jgi:hypothetical protein
VSPPDVLKCFNTHPHSSKYGNSAKSSNYSDSSQAVCEAWSWVNSISIPLGIIGNDPRHYFRPRLTILIIQVGECDLLLEIMPKKGRNALVVTQGEEIQLASRAAKFKFGVFGQPDTNWSDSEIIAAGKHA